ncbi:MAG: apolipoprotein N-acyltransferase, partial [Propionibacteriaceae bacterium]|nr:apolipoprotein N-acyltransferase [Propionibacteriaceae bacterium]
ITGLAFQPFNLWLLIFIGIAGFTMTLRTSDRILPTLGLGLGYGLGLCGTTLNWMAAIFFEAMVAMVVAVALFYAVLALGIHLSLRSRFWPLLAAGCWTVLETVITRWPFDGFGWVRIGYAMIDSPLAWGYPLIGVVGVGFATTLCSQWLAWLVQNRKPKLTARKLISGLTGLAVPVGVCSCGLAIPPGEVTDQVVVGWVQGGAPGGGVYGLGPVRTITKNQVLGTQRLIESVQASELADPDFIVWPENGTDLDPMHDNETLNLVKQALALAQRPLLLGIMAKGPGEKERQTASLWWNPTGEPGPYYAKRGIVPFGEWVPHREILEPLFPVLSYVGAQSVRGTEPGVMQVKLNDERDLNIGILVCYDVSFDSYVYDVVKAEAQVIVVQSSNAMYQGTGQIAQQFAMTRVRAAEIRREIQVVTTSGASGLIGPYGEILRSAPHSASAYGVDTMALRSGQTPAIWLASWLEIVLTIGCLVGVIGCGLLSTVKRSFAASRMEK